MTRRRDMTCTMHDGLMSQPTCAHSFRTRPGLGYPADLAMAYAHTTARLYNAAGPRRKIQANQNGLRQLLSQEAPSLQHGVSNTVEDRTLVARGSACSLVPPMHQCPGSMPSAQPWTIPATSSPILSDIRRTELLLLQALYPAGEVGEGQAGG